jgi:hypothetical protein
MAFEHLRVSRGATLTTPAVNPGRPKSRMWMMAGCSPMPLMTALIDMPQSFLRYDHVPDRSARRRLIPEIVRDSASPAASSTSMYLSFLM